MARTTDFAEDRSETASDRSTTDAYYRALANERRRIAIRALETRGAMHLDALTELLARRERGDASRDAVRISLVHQHLPLLAEAGIADYDAVEERVVMRQTVEELRSPFGSEAN